MARKRNKLTNTASKLGSIRIIGGKYRGQKVPVRDQEGLRPTTDRIKETVFNWLQSDIVGADCVDLFCGAGALSFEAVSRGAKHLTAIDIDHNNTKLLEQSKQRLAVDNMDIVCTDALQWLQGQSDKADIIFIDPPFASELLNACLALLSKHPCIQDNTIIYIESAKRHTISLPANWCWHRHKTNGDVQYGIAIINTNA